MTMKLIASTTVGSGGQASITFSNIPQEGFTDLLLVFSLRVTNDLDNFELRFNNSTANFSLRTLIGNGISASSGSRTDSVIQSTVTGSSTTASTFGNSQIYIPNYRSSAAKSFSVDGVTENNGTSAFQGIIAGLWNNTAAITSIGMFARNSGSFVQHSTASLYGITAGSDGIVSVS